MKTYQEMAEAVFREGDRRLAVHQKRRRMALTGGAAGIAVAVGLAAVGLWRHTAAVVPKTLPGTPVTEVVTQAAPPAATGQQQTAETHGQTAKTETAPPIAPRQPSEEEITNGGGVTGRETPAVSEEPAVPPQTEPTEPPASESVPPSGNSGAASYNSNDRTEATVDRQGWARFPRRQGYEDKFWVYYEGRTYRCDPFAGRPLAYGDYLCALSDCAHDFADEEGAGVYVLLENDEPVPTTAAVAIVFPDGGSYAMIRPDTD